MSFRIGKFPVFVEPIFFVIVAVLAASRLSHPLYLLTWVLVVFGSILLHELGHALAFWRYGYAPSIRLHGMGGHTTAAASLSPKKDIVVSLAGPVFGLALGLTVYLVGMAVPAIHTTPVLGVIVSDLLWVNIGWSVINLFPILPMDGGRVLIARLRQTDPGRATIRAHQISMIAAGIAGAVALSFGMLFGAMLGGLFAFNNYQAVQQLR